MLSIALTHWGRVTHICVGNLAIIGSHNGLSPGRRQAITWTNVGILLIGPLGTNFSEKMLIKIHIFSFKKIHLKMSSGKWWPFCLGLNVLTHWGQVIHIYVDKLGHYLNQCWFVVNWHIGNKLQWNPNRNSKIFFTKKCIWKCLKESGSHFVAASIC